MSLGYYLEKPPDEQEKIDINGPLPPMSTYQGPMSPASASQANPIFGTTPAYSNYNLDFKESTYPSYKAPYFDSDIKKADTSDWAKNLTAGLSLAKTAAEAYFQLKLAESIGKIKGTPNPTQNQLAEAAEYQRRLDAEKSKRYWTYAIVAGVGVAVIGSIFFFTRKR